MSELQKDIKRAILKMIVRSGVDAVEVTDWEDRTEHGGYCETCAYEYVVVDITYVDSEGARKTYVYDSSFSDLIASLTRD
jgi:hypothetical protein